MRRVLCSLLAAIALTVVYIPAASASAEWCEDDPAVSVQLDSGRNVVIHVTNRGELGGSAERRLDIRKAVTSAQVVALRDTASDVDGKSAYTVVVNIRGTSELPSNFNFTSRVGTRPRSDDLAAETAAIAGPGQTPLEIHILVGSK